MSASEKPVAFERKGTVRDERVLVHNELNVVKPHYAYTLSQLQGVVQNGFLYLPTQAERRINAYAVARVYARAFNQLHDSRHEHVRSVAHGVHLALLAHYVFVYKHGLFFVDSDGVFEIVPERVVAAHNLHRAPAQNKARSDKHGIAYFVCGSHAVLDFGNGISLGLRNIQLFEDFFKRIPVLGALDCFDSRADYVDVELF